MHFDRISGTSRKVIAPVQYFPLLGLKPNSRFHRYNQVPQQETQGDIEVYHPRYITLPGTTIISSVDAMVKSAHKIWRDVYPQGEDCDVIDGHYLYPDGVAAYKLAKAYDKPLILTARGSDVNYWMEQKSHKAEILEAIGYAQQVICVSQALKNKLIEHGVDEKKLTVLINGVDKTFFDACPSTDNGDDKNNGDYLLSVGNLVPLKGHAYILEALQALPHEKLTIIGSGELEHDLKNLAQSLGVEGRVTFLNHISHDDLPCYYADAKCTILMSSMEGMPNVVLESLATGTPVIATAVGGIPEVITPENGLLLTDRTGGALVQSLTLALAHKWNRPKISQDMSYLNWTETTQKLYGCFAQAL